MPRPWMNYEAQRFLAWIIERAPEPMNVFEWGAGGSTKWLRAHGKVRDLITVEHDKRWQFPGVDLVDLGPNYEADIKRRCVKFDLILVDGRRRVECIKAAIPHVEVNGWLVLDDSQRERYRPGVLAVPERWTRVTINGIGDGGQFWRTTFWHRAAECLES